MVLLGCMWPTIGYPCQGRPFPHNRTRTTPAGGRGQDEERNPNVYSSQWVCRLRGQCVLPSRFPRLALRKVPVARESVFRMGVPCVLRGGLRHLPHFTLLVNMFTGKESESSIDGVESCMAVCANPNRVPTIRPAEAAG